MSAELDGCRVTLSATPTRLTALMQVARPGFIGLPYNSLAIRADNDNTGEVRILRGNGGTPTDTVGFQIAYLGAGEVWGYAMPNAGVHTDGIWLVGTAADTAWVSGEIL